MKKIAFTLAAILTTLSLFGCTSNNNQSTPPVPPPLNEIYFAGGGLYDKSTVFYFNYNYVGKENLVWSNFILTGTDTNIQNTSLIIYNGSYELPKYITPYSTITYRYIIERKHDSIMNTILHMEFRHIDNNRNTISIIDSKDFETDYLIKLLQTTNQ